MKHNTLMFLLFLLTYSASARLLAAKDGEEIKATEITHSGAFTERKDLTDLMGLENCEDKDEECLKRRMVAEAHLDYIYTQHHKP